MRNKGLLFKKDGFVLIEALTVIFIFSLISLAFFGVLSLGLRYIQDAKNRLGAISLANERMEIIRNLKYDDVGTDSGAISGRIPQNQDVVANAKQYHVNTLVEYQDDSSDGLFPADPTINDYKKVTVTVSWFGASGNDENVKMISRFVPQGIEVINPGDGILSINVFSDQPGGTGIPNATVHVVNGETGLDTTVHTNNTGNFMLIGDRIEESIQKYEISVSKAGYESVATLPPPPSTAFNPRYPHASVTTGLVNQANIAQNKLARLKVATINNLNEAVPDIGFHVEGGKEIGRMEELPNDIVYSLDSDYTTDSSGEKDFGEIGPGQFNFTFSLASTNYELIRTDPAPPFSLLSDQDVTFKAKLASKNVASLLVKVIRSDDSKPAVDASVEVTSGAGYNSTLFTDGNGTAFFPTDNGVFAPGVYHLRVTAGGMADVEEDVTVNPGELKVETVSLSAI